MHCNFAAEILLTLNTFYFKQNINTIFNFTRPVYYGELKIFQVLTKFMLF